MYSPVLNPLTAALAPQGMVGQTLGTFAALQTTFSAIGPLVAGALLGAGLAGSFLALHLGISVVAVYAAWRLRRVMAARPAPVQTSSSTGVSSSRPASPTERESVAA